VTSIKDKQLSVTGANLS